MKDLKTLSEEFTAAYEWLYEYGDRTPAAAFAIADYDSRIQDKESSFFKAVTDFMNYRQDVISSDREAAAFMIAYKKLYAV